MHYTLYVDSRRELQGKGFAEAFLRFPPETYRALLTAWVEVLRERRSELVRRPRSGG